MIECKIKNSIFTCIATDYVELDMEWEREQYEKAGIIFQAYQLRNAEPGELIAASSGADVLIVDQAKITGKVLSRLPRCKLIIRHGDGYDNLDIKTATKLGIVCANKPGFWSREVAETAFSLSLALFLKLGEQRRIASAPRSGGSGWDLKRAMPQHRLANQIIGIVGFGKIGRIAAGLFRGICREIMVYDPYIDEKTISAEGYRAAGEDELLSRSDLVTLHIPATAETEGFFNLSRISRMKRGALLVNTARGSLVRTNDLAEAIHSGQLGGAALDVTNPEPLPSNHPLFNLPNVIITPHLGWYSEDALWSMRRSIVEDVKSAVEGKTPDSVINPEVCTSPKLRITGGQK